MAFPLTDDLRQQYQRLFDTCIVNPGRIDDVGRVIARILPNQQRYQEVAGPLGIPWYFVALVHNMEASLNFSGHLHNGDPLTARTVRVPAGRPAAGHPHSALLIPSPRKSASRSERPQRSSGSLNGPFAAGASSAASVGVSQAAHGR